jgi:hypothetical protein
MNQTYVNRLAIAGAIAGICGMFLLTGGKREAPVMRCGDDTGVAQIEMYDGEENAVALPGFAHVGTEVAPAAPVEVSNEDLGKVRRAVSDLVKEKFAGAKVEGVFALPFRTGSLYFAGADTTFEGSGRRTVDMLVRQYTKRTGGTYWRGELLSETEAEAYRKQLNP